MNMWAGGRAYGYIRFKKIMPTENMGWGAATAICTGSDPCADVVITINNHNSSRRNAIIYRWSSLLAVADRAVRLLGVCFAWVNLCTYWNILPAVTLPPCPYKFWSSLKNGFFYNYYNIYYNRATINAQRIRTDYLRLLACVICPRGRVLLVRRVICAWYIGRDE